MRCRCYDMPLMAVSRHYALYAFTRGDIYMLARYDARSSAILLSAIFQRGAMSFTLAQAMRKRVMLMRRVRARTHMLLMRDARICALPRSRRAECELLLFCRLYAARASMSRRAHLMRR